MYVRTDPGGLGGMAVPQGTVTAYQCELDPIVIDDFIVGDYRLRPVHYERLMNLLQRVNVMKGSGVKVTLGLTGHTDASGTEKMNTGLSLSRAHEVQTFFTRQRVPVHDASGEGETKPRASNATEAGRRKNRRVEIMVCVPMSPTPGSTPRVA